MLRGIYAAGAGMAAGLDQLDVIADNAANVQTPGFKGRIPVVAGFRSLLLSRVRDGPVAAVGSLSTGSRVEDAVTDFSPGPMRPVEDPLAVALSGPGFFVVQTPWGEAYTRNGMFRLDARGRLVTGAGHPVLGEHGPIEAGADAAILPDGTVVSGGGDVGRLRVVEFARPDALRRVGDSLFLAGPEAGLPRPVEPALLPGFVEGANVNPVTEMVRLIAVLRAYEACQKALRAQDETLGQAVREIARI
ncbi:MAG: flagellar hook-basal body protein [Bacillota bacterium]|nr:flagellar hook-basal body protein [Bacillota bacterium]MDI7249560.1 flagellar hook-basal body protein [Bacillota bacterium]